jgi:23S rRNA pseudouridine1911/1915/1917 synthase
MAFLNVSQDERPLFQNEAYLVINKLPGESSGFPDLDEAPAEKFFPVHRLDTPVSGCKKKKKIQVAAAFLGSAFAGKEYKAEKRFWAVVEMPQKEIPAEAELVHWITENKKANKAFAYDVEEIPRDGLSGGGGRRGNARPQKAVLHYRVIRKGERYLFLEIDLVTGRHHQIWAQLAAMGLHVKGDLKYGAGRSEKGGGIRLHAYSLAFPNPLDPSETIRPDRIILVEAPPPVADALWEAFAAAMPR